MECEAETTEFSFWHILSQNQSLVLAGTGKGPKEGSRGNYRRQQCACGEEADTGHGTRGLQSAVCCVPLTLSPSPDQEAPGEAWQEEGSGVRTLLAWIR